MRAAAPTIARSTATVGRDVFALRGADEDPAADAPTAPAPRHTHRRPQRPPHSGAHAARRNRTCAANKPSQPGAEIARERAHVAHRDEAAAGHRALRPDLGKVRLAETFADQREMVGRHAARARAPRARSALRSTLRRDRWSRTAPLRSCERQQREAGAGARVRRRGRARCATRTRRTDRRARSGRR